MQFIKQAQADLTHGKCNALIRKVLSSFEEGATTAQESATRDMGRCNSLIAQARLTARQAATLGRLENDQIWFKVRSALPMGVACRKGEDG